MRTVASHSLIVALLLVHGDLGQRSSHLLSSKQAVARACGLAGRVRFVQACERPGGCHPVRSPVQQRTAKDECAAWQGFNNQEAVVGK